MDLKDITRTLAAQNPGEELLVEISNALNAGKQPSEQAVRKLDEAVAAMLSEEDTQERLNWLQRKLGLPNPEGRPPNKKRARKVEQGKRMAQAYWRHWLSGCKKGEAREKVWEEFQSSGEFKESYPSPDTVKENVKRFPEQAKRVYSAWISLSTPSKEEIKRAVDEIKSFLNKHQEKTS